MSLSAVTVARVVVGLALAAAAPGCAHGPAAAEYLPPRQCPPLATGATVSPPAPGALPAGFAAVEARRCTFTMLHVRQPSPDPGPVADGGWRWESVQRSTGPLDELVRALRLPPPRRDGSEDPICPADAVRPFTLALVDAAGRTVVPAVPATACGRPLPEVTAAVEALSWTTVDTRVPG